MREEKAGRAVSYFYLLKEDEEGTQKLWSLLAGDAAMPPAEDALSLDLTGGGVESTGMCRLVQRTAGTDGHRCLLLLPDLAAVQSVYMTAAGVPLGEQWREALGRLEADRARVTDAGLGVFGETTVLLADDISAAGADTGGFEAAAAEFFPAGQRLASKLSRETGARGVLINIPDQGDRDFYAIAADRADGFLASSFPQMDSLIKQLRRVTAHFRDQRRTVVRQREEIDSQVGMLLHQQVVKGGAAMSASVLEERIASLSRMFGLLSTDSLLLRQAGDHLERDTATLRGLFTLDLGTAEEGPGPVGEYYLDEFSGDLGQMHKETLHLDFSRINAQAAIEVVRTQVELLRAGEEAAIQKQTRELLSRSLILQKERMSLQVAAGFVEFVLVFYYVLKSWEGVVGQQAVEHLSPALRALLAGGFSAGAAIGTHFLAQTLQTKSLRNAGLWISVAVLVLSFTAMVMLTVFQN